jgi:anti-sigma factor RsiW
LNCRDTIRELSNYIDGELELAIRHELERHFEHCEDCMIVLIQTRKSIQILCDCEPLPLSADLHSRLHQALRDRIARGRS